MSRLVILYSGVFVLLLLLSPSTADTTRSALPERPRNERSATVQLEEPREAVREEVIQVGGGGESEWVVSVSSDSIPLLIRYLRSPNEIVQRAALAEFASMGPKAKSAAPAILAALNDSKSSIRVEAAATLIHMNTQSQAALRTLRKELKAEDATAREYAARTIGELVKPPDFLGVISCWGPDPPPPVARPWVGKRTLPALVEALRDNVPKVRIQAAHTLGLLGPDASPTLPALLRALTDDEKAVREAAKQSLRRIHRKTTAKAAHKTLSN